MSDAADEVPRTWRLIEENQIARLRGNIVAQDWAEALSSLNSLSGWITSLRSNLKHAIADERRSHGQT